MSDQLRNLINDIIEGEIQLGINDYLKRNKKKKNNKEWVLLLQKKQKT